MSELAILTLHGGQLATARRLFPLAPQPWLDLSTGINTIPYLLPLVPAGAWVHLPDPCDLEALEAVAAERYRVTAGCEVVAAPGTQALIQRLPALCKGRDVRVLGPTFSEFENVFRSFGRAVRVVAKIEALDGADVGVVVNPNNPDGRFVPIEDLLTLSQRVGTLVVDEAFVDALPSSSSIVPRLIGNRVVVLRSFGKFYGLAGLRLGFAILAHEGATTLRAMLGPWPVSGPALEIGRKALSDKRWAISTSTRLKTDAARLTFLLRQVGASVVGGTSLFRLVTHPAAPALFKTLAELGILARPFSQEPSWLRLGFPGTNEDWTRLETALLKFR